MRPAWRSPTRSEFRRNGNQRLSTRAALLPTTVETRPRRDGSLTRQPGNADRRPYTGHRRRCHLTPSIVSTGQYKTRHTFLAQATSADARRASQRGRSGQEDELDIEYKTTDATTSPKLKLPQAPGQRAVVTRGRLHPVTAAWDSDRLLLETDAQ
ncbi:hypothetical protein MTO96_031900 [Rhipicephalus appendiculatus]